MIAQSFTNSDTSDYGINYYFTFSNSSYYWEKPDPEPSASELRARWWKYINAFLKPVESVFAWLPVLIRKVHPQRIHHERQYPRIIKYRNNRLP